MSNIGVPQYSVRPVNPDGSWNLQWYLFFQQQYIRNGGAIALTNIELASAINKVSGRAGMADDGADQSEPLCVPGPAGQQGIQGIPGPSLYVLFDDSDDDPYSAALSMRKP